MPDSRADCTRSIEIFAASCSGCAELSRSIDLPLACLRASIDAHDAIAAMNEAWYAAGALWVDSFQPFETQRGWRDWHLQPLAPSGDQNDDARLHGGRLRLELPAYVATAAFEAALHDELSRLRLDSVTTSPEWLIARSDAGQPLFIPTRYTLIDPNDFRSGVTRVDDLFVIEPSRHLALVARLATRALARAVHVAKAIRDDD